MTTNTQAAKKMTTGIVAIGFQAAAIGAILLLLPAPHLVSRAAGNPNLAGTWKLNKDQSDDPRQKMQEAMGGENGGGFGNRQGRGEGRRGGMMEDLSQLTITQTGDSVRVAGKSGNVLAATADNQQKSEQSAESDQEGERGFPADTLQWKDSQLVSEREGRNGGKTTRTYALSPDGKQLYVTTTMNNPRFSQPVTFRSVYDSVKPQ